jgi:hypothetical protein|tara:strand:+ start:1625 stop:2080 length:456 start_codon:yes stop_codon:yes gene_type:complete
MRIVLKNEYLRKILVFAIILSNISCFSQKNECSNQIEIIRNILNDIQFNNLIINKKTINIENSLCQEKSEKMLFKNKSSVNLCFLKGKTKSEDKISFLDYQKTNSIVYAELSIFHKNAIFSILLRKQKDENLVLINSWMKFIKREKDSNEK